MAQEHACGLIDSDGRSKPASVSSAQIPANGDTKKLLHPSFPDMAPDTNHPHAIGRTIGGGTQEHHNG